MEIAIIDAGTFLCDGGGIFGSVPKLLWNRQVDADENNLIKLAMRCLLVVEGERKVLIETGAGEKLSSKFIDNNGIDNKDRLINSLQIAGYKPEDITDVIHTHLHWDHCGGGTCYDAKKKVVLTFPNATYHCGRSQWENALNPNPREGDAYFYDDIIPLEKSGMLNLIDRDCELFNGLELRLFNGHTPGMIVPIIDYRGKKLIYITDLIPMVANIPPKWVAAYDLYPVTAMEEKQQFLGEVFKNDSILFFEHDPLYECATIRWDERKGPQADKKGTLAEFIA